MTINEAVMVVTTDLLLKFDMALHASGQAAGWRSVGAPVHPSHRPTLTNGGTVPFLMKFTWPACHNRVNRPRDGRMSICACDAAASPRHASACQRRLGAGAAMERCRSGLMRDEKSSSNMRRWGPRMDSPPRRTGPFKLRTEAHGTQCAAARCAGAGNAGCRISSRLRCGRRGRSNPSLSLKEATWHCACRRRRWAAPAARYRR